MQSSYFLIRKIKNGVTNLEYFLSHFLPSNHNSCNSHSYMQKTPSSQGDNTNPHLSPYPMQSSRCLIFVQTFTSSLYVAPSVPYLQIAQNRQVMFQKILKIIRKKAVHVALLCPAIQKLQGQLICPHPPHSCTFTDSIPNGGTGTNILR